MAGVTPELAGHDQVEETAADLIARAAEAGYTVTRDQLTRWHRRHLLPKPRQVSRGRKGSELRFPPGTSEQLLELLLLKKIVRTLDKVGWGLWWSGYVVPDDLARDYIVTLIETNRDLLGQLVTADGELTDKAHDVLDAGQSGDISAGTIRRARRRVGRDDFQFFMQALLLVGAGQTDLIKTEDLEMLEHGMAMDRARTDPLASTGGPWLKGDNVRGDFESISRLTDWSFQLEMLDGASDVELRAARDQAKVFMQVVVNVGEMVRTAGASAFGYGAFGRDFSEIGAMPDGQAYMTVALLAMAQAGFAQGITDTTSELENSQIGVKRHRIVMELRAAVPELESVISDYRLKVAMQSTEANERLQADIRAARQDLSEEIDAFFAAHPEYREFLET